MTEQMNPLESARRQIKKACEVLGTDPAVYEILKDPERMIEISIPVFMDDGSLKTFKGYRSVHSTAKGPGKGGIRFHPDVYGDEVKALSMWMSFKCEIAGIPYGGGKGGIAVDPKEVSKKELEQIARGYVRGLYKYLGETVDIPAPDVGVSGEVIAWMVDEYNLLTGSHAIGTFTGKPIAIGGSKGRNEATGLGVAIMTGEALKKEGKELAGTRCAVQGFGNVGSFTVKHLEDRGAEVEAVLEFDKEHGPYGIYKKGGFSYEELADYMEENGTLYGYGDAISEEEFFSSDVDVLIPAALENAVTEEVAEKVNASMIVEAANGPLTPEADEVFKKRGIPVVLDILANGGGVVVSYFEWVQNRYGYYWTEEDVARRQEEKMKESFERIYSLKEERDTDYRSAAYLYSVKNLAEIMKLKGRY